MPTSTDVTVEIDGDVTPALLLLRQIAARLCPVCQHYAARRARVIGIWVAVYADRFQVNPVALFSRYLGSVHARHLAGESLSTRIHTPNRTIDGETRLHVKRSCNGCQKSLGDVRDDELDAGMAGRPLPDVRLECGCWTQDAAA